LFDATFFSFRFIDVLAIIFSRCCYACYGRYY